MPAPFEPNMLTSAATNSITALTISAQALASADNAQSPAVIILGVLLFAGIATGVVIYRNFETTRNFCAGLNLFGQTERTILLKAGIPQAQSLLNKSGEPSTSYNSKV